MIIIVNYTLGPDQMIGIMQAVLKPGDLIRRIPDGNHVSIIVIIHVHGPGAEGLVKRIREIMPCKLLASIVLPPRQFRSSLGCTDEVTVAILIKISSIKPQRPGKSSQKVLDKGSISIIFIPCYFAADAGSA